MEHEEKKELTLIYGGNRYSFDFQIMARDFAKLLEENINDPSFYDFVLPDFSTTEPSDTVICSILMMSILKPYFTYRCEFVCGIPQITLLGTKEDYLNILQRVENLSQMGMGDEPTVFAKLLRPIIKEFIAVFDAAESSPNNPQVHKKFWERICHEESEGSGSTLLGGWITAFCVWDGKGRWQGPDLQSLKCRHDGVLRKKPLIIEGMEYPLISINDIPSGFCDADVLVNDNGQELRCVVVAGHIATEVLEVVQDDGRRQKKIMGAVRPAAQWFMFEKEEVITKVKK